MSFSRYSLFVLCFSGSMVSCSPPEVKEDKSISSGQKVMETEYAKRYTPDVLEDTIPIVREVTTQVYCTMGEPAITQGVVIQNQTDYEHFMTTAYNLKECGGKKVLPAIDFEKHTLLAKYAEEGGCHFYFKRKVFRDKQRKEIIFDIQPVHLENEGCDSLGYSFNMVLVPRIPKEYRVKFNAWNQ